MMKHFLGCHTFTHGHAMSKVTTTKLRVFLANSTVQLATGAGDRMTIMFTMVARI